MVTIDAHFEVDKKARDIMINDIVAKLPEKTREEAKKRVTTLVNNYVGRDLDALSVLLYASEQNRVDEFTDKLEKLYQEILKYVHPEARRHSIMPGAVTSESRIIAFYEQLGIKPRQ